MPNFFAPTPQEKNSPSATRAVVAKVAPTGNKAGDLLNYFSRAVRARDDHLGLATHSPLFERDYSRGYVLPRKY